MNKYFIQTFLFKRKKYKLNNIIENLNLNNKILHNNNLKIVTIISLIPQINLFLN